ncbi:MAG: hypothetical protein Q9180_006661, partial [Flavoplaca navasiana]
LVQIDTEQLKDKTQVLFVDECVFEPKKMVVIILVKLAIKLGIISIYGAIKLGKRHTKSNTETSIML